MTWLMCVWHDMTHVCVTWHDLCVWHDIAVYCLRGVYLNRASQTRHDSFMRDTTRACVTWLICTWHDSIIPDVPQLYLHLYLYPYLMYIYIVWPQSYLYRYLHLHLHFIHVYTSIFNGHNCICIYNNIHILCVSITISVASIVRVSTSTSLSTLSTFNLHQHLTCLSLIWHAYTLLHLSGIYSNHMSTHRAIDSENIGPFCGNLGLFCQNTGLFRGIIGHLIWIRCQTRRRIEYGVATISRLLKMIGFFCRISSLL